MDKPEKSKPIKPKSLHINVVENGKVTTDVSIPFFLVKMGMKFAQKEVKGDDLKMLEEVDLDSIIDALNSGELSIPCTLINVEEADKNKHVTITLQ